MTALAGDTNAGAKIWGTVPAVLGTGLAAAVISLCLFGDCPAMGHSVALGAVLGEVGAALTDPGTQWMVFGCAGVYLVSFLVLRSRLSRTRWSPSFPNLVSQAGLMVFAALAYTVHYGEAVKSTQALTLVGAAMVGQGAAFWESRKQKVESRNGGGAIAVTLILLLTIAAVWHREAGYTFQYRGQARWSGPWDNPNIFGVLMGVGFVLALGRMVSGNAEMLKTEKLKAEGVKAESRKQKAERDGQCPPANIEHPISNWGEWVRKAFYLAAAGAMGVGLVKSYSRGAWVGTAVGVAYLAYQVGKAEKLKTEMLKTGHRWVALSVICASIAVLTFWSFRETEWRVARRVVSVGNINDFSWRNRVAAWEGALQMMADKPWFGFGWNQPERVYDSFYRPARLTEGGAMQMNDYLMLGSTLGVPALLCFLMYVGLCLKGSPRSKAQSPKFNGQRTEDRGQRTEVGGRRAEDRGRRTEGGLPNTDHRSLATDHWAKAVCRAGAVVLLVGFWFDGGLFKLATAAPFWILLELGRDE